jgi:purine nucleosidase
VKIIIDTDPGQDDAVAILLALASPELDVLGITAVAGNVPLPLTSRNSLMMCELAGRADVPVFAGADRPMTRALVTAEYVHGKTGIDGADLPEPQLDLQDQHAVDWLIDAIGSSAPGEITLCTLGPLTNVGMALDREPAIADRLGRLVLMGGGFFEGGNTTPAAEFNIYVDPQAADIVFRSGIPLTMFPLDVTHKALSTEPRIVAFEELDTAAGDAVAGMLRFFERYDVEKYGMEGGPLHDPTVIAHLLQPELFAGKACNVRIETESELTMGMTVVDWWKTSGLEPNCMVMRDLDADGFFALLVERIGTL